MTTTSIYPHRHAVRAQARGMGVQPEEVIEMQCVAGPGCDEAGLRENRVAQTFVTLADTLVDEFDPAEFLHLLVDRCVELLEVDAAGVLLTDQNGGVHMAAASSEKAELLELFAAETQEGPCIECLSTGRLVSSHDLAAEADRWPRFAAAAELCGFTAAHALPMRLRRDVIGALALFGVVGSGAHSYSAQLGQAFADVATIGILQQRAHSRAELVSEQLQSALDTRVIIEQAKGVLAARSGALTPEQAFVKLRGYARARRLRLSVLAHEVTTGTAPITAILDHPGP